MNHIPQCSRPHTQASAGESGEPSSIETGLIWHARLFLNKHTCAVLKRCQTFPFPSHLCFPHRLTDSSTASSAQAFSTREKLLFLSRPHTDNWRHFKKLDSGYWTNQALLHYSHPHLILLFSHAGCFFYCFVFTGIDKMQTNK